MRARSLARWVALAGMTFACMGGIGPPSIGTTDWRTTGGDPGNSRYSTLDQINRNNVATLRVAWIHHTGDLTPNRSEIQATPIVVDGVLYTKTPALASLGLCSDLGTLLYLFKPF